MYLLLIGVEGLCILLRRLSYPNRLTDLVKQFNRSAAAISKIFNWMLSFVYSSQCKRISTLNQKWIQDNLGSFSKVESAWLTIEYSFACTV